MTETRPPFRTIPLREYHERRADIAHRVFEDELEEHPVATAFAVTPSSIERQAAVSFEVCIDGIERTMGRTGFKLALYRVSSEGLSMHSDISFAVSHSEDPARERSPMIWEIIGRPLVLKDVGTVKYGFLHYALDDRALQQFTSRSWHIPDDIDETRQ